MERPSAPKSRPQSRDGAPRRRDGPPDAPQHSSGEARHPESRERHDSHPAPPPDGDGGRNKDPKARTDWRKPGKRRGGGRRGGRHRRRGGQRDGAGPDGGAPTGNAEGGAPPAPLPAELDREPAVAVESSPEEFAHERRRPHPEAPRMPSTGSGMFVAEGNGWGVLRQADHQFLPSRADIFVPERLVSQNRLREGSLVAGRIGRGQKHKYALLDVATVDGKSPNEVKSLPAFKTLTTIDPDFHYAVGDATGDVSMRILDLICPVGRGQRGLIVAPPRAGKTTILRQFAKGIEVGYPDVQLMVLLVDERPEEATEWKRCTNGQVFVSTADESPKNHVQLAEAVWKRATRLVELGQDVVILLDSITRLARAYNNLAGGSGRTMSGGLDSRAMERPRQIFGSARNTEKAGSLTILGTTLIETGSRMDQLIFEEFKGTGNMELVLSRKLADRRIFPAIDIEKSGTRKEEKLYTAKRMKYIGVLRRVLLRMNFIEAMELLVTRLSDVDTNDDFLKRFEVDPEA